MSDQKSFGDFLNDTSLLHIPAPQATSTAAKDTDKLEKHMVGALNVSDVLGQLFVPKTAAMDQSSLGLLSLNGMSGLSGSVLRVEGGESPLPAPLPLQSAGPPLRDTFTEQELQQLRLLLADDTFGSLEPPSFQQDFTVMSEKQPKGETFVKPTAPPPKVARPGATAAKVRAEKPNSEVQEKMEGIPSYLVTHALPLDYSESGQAPTDLSSFHPTRIFQQQLEFDPKQISARSSSVSSSNGSASPQPFHDFRSSFGELLAPLPAMQGGGSPLPADSFEFLPSAEAKKMLAKDEEEFHLQADPLGGVAAKGKDCSWQQPADQSVVSLGQYFRGRSEDLGSAPFNITADVKESESETEDDTVISTSSISKILSDITISENPNIVASKFLEHILEKKNKKKAAARIERPIPPVSSVVAPEVDTTGSTLKETSLPPPELSRTGAHLTANTYESRTPIVTTPASEVASRSSVASTVESTTSHHSVKAPPLVLDGSALLRSQSLLQLDTLRFSQESFPRRYISMENLSGPAPVCHHHHCACCEPHRQPAPCCCYRGASPMMGPSPLALTSPPVELPLVAGSVPVAVGDTFSFELPLVNRTAQTLHYRLETESASINGQPDRSLLFLPIPSLVLEPGSSASFQVVHRAQQPGRVTGRVGISPSVGPCYLVPLSLEVVLPRVTVSPSSLEVGPQGAALTLQVSGRAEVSVRLALTPPDCFFLKPSPYWQLLSPSVALGLLPPATAVPVDLSCHPSAGSIQGSLTVCLESKWQVPQGLATASLSCSTARSLQLVVKHPTPQEGGLELSAGSSTTLVVCNKGPYPAQDVPLVLEPPLEGITVVPKHLTLPPGGCGPIQVACQGVPRILGSTTWLVARHPQASHPPLTLMELRPTSAQKRAGPVSQLETNRRHLTWGGLEPGQDAEVKAVKLKNSSSSLPLELVMYLKGEGSAAFRLVEIQDGCGGLRLGPQQCISLRVAFQPPGVGPSSARLIIQTSVNTKFSIGLHGYGGCSRISALGLDSQNHMELTESGLARFSLSNEGSQPAFLIIKPFADESLQELLDKNTVTVQPSQFILRAKDVKSIFVASPSGLTNFCLAIFHGDEPLRRAVVRGSRQTLQPHHTLASLDFWAPFDDEASVTIDGAYLSGPQDWQLFLSQLQQLVVEVSSCQQDHFTQLSVAQETVLPALDVSPPIRDSTPLVEQDSNNNTAAASSRESFGGRRRVFATPEVLEFPPTVCGASSKLKLTVKNYTASACTLQVDPLNPPFLVKSTELTIKSKFYLNMHIHFQPQESGHYSSLLTLTPPPHSCLPPIHVTLRGSSPP